MEALAQVTLAEDTLKHLRWQLLKIDLLILHLQDLQKCNRELFFCLLQKQRKVQTTF